jgi:hypothetical protein
MGRHSGGFLLRYRKGAQNATSSVVDPKLSDKTIGLGYMLLQSVAGVP